MKNIKSVFIFLNVIFIAVLMAFLSYQKTFDDKDNELSENSIILEDKVVLLNNFDKSLYVNTYEQKRGENEFEEIIINNKYDQEYKLVNLTIEDFKSYMLVVYNPANVKLMVSPKFNTLDNSGKERMLDMVKRYGAVAGVNAGGFFDNGEISTDTPIGYVIKDGKVLWGNPNRVGNLIGFNNDNRLTLVKSNAKDAINNGMRDAIEFGPFLMVDGVITDDAINMAEKRAARVVIGQREDGIVLMLVTDGGTYVGPKMKSIVNIMKSFGVYNLANLDGGPSSQMVVGDKLYNTATVATGAVVKNGRPVVNGFGVFVS